MAITRTKKVTILDYLQKQGLNQKSIVIFSTNKTKETFNAESNFKLRFSARKKGVVIQLAKNSLIQIAFPSIKEDLVGQTYIAFMEDPKTSSEVEVPKVMVSELADNFKNQFNLIGSVVNGQFYDNDSTTALSKVPSFDESMAALAGTINQITAKIALTIKEIPASVARGIQAAKK